MIDTGRLHLRPLRADDLEAFHALTDDEETRRYLSSVSRREDSYKRLMMSVGGWAAHGFSTFAVEDRATGAMVGSCGLFCMVRTLDVDTTEEVEAGWVITRDLWGQGLAREAMRAAHAWFDGAQGRQRTICMIVPGNTASERIATGLEYRPFRTARHLGDEVRLWERLST